MARALWILGPVELVGPAGPLRLGAAKERCLLAVVALHLDESVGQDELADVVDARLAERLIAEGRKATAAGDQATPKRRR
jgi:hypothetical protein